MNFKFKKLVTYNKLTILVLIFVAIVIAYNQFVIVSFAETNLAYNDLNKLQELSLEKLTQMTELLISLGTAIIGLIGYLTVSKYKEIINISDKEKFFAIASISFSTLSIYFGYTSLEKWVELLSNDMFNPYDPLVEKPHKLQFTYFFISIILLGIFILSTINKNEK